MRRAMKDIVPPEILERRRKAFLLKTPLAQLKTLQPYFEGLIDTSVLAEAGYIDQSALRRALMETANGQDIRWLGWIYRAMGLETWIRARFQSHHDTTQYQTSTVAL
jgi:asparagine synthase (glutamine-hydrolysing)